MFHNYFNVNQPNRISTQETKPTEKRKMTFLKPKDRTSSFLSRGFQTHLHLTPKVCRNYFVASSEQGPNTPPRLIPESEEAVFSPCSGHLQGLSSTWSQHWAGTSLILPQDAEVGIGRASSPHIFTRSSLGSEEE